MPTPERDPNPPIEMKRRAEDRDPQTAIKIALYACVLSWAGLFCQDMAKESGIEAVLTLSFMSSHLGQLFTMLGAVYAARKLNN